MPTLQEIADGLVRRAQRQGYIVSRDIRTELKLAGLAETQWKEVLSLTGPALHHRQGRYYHPSALRPQLHREQKQQRVVQRIIRRLLKQHKAAVKHSERRGQDRVDFIQPILVEAEDGEKFTLLSRDLSTTGIRLVGTRRLLGQKALVALPQGDGKDPCRLWTRILWTCAIGDDLFENGGMFLEIAKNDVAT